VGQVLLQSDLQYERYHLPLPQSLWNLLVPPPAGLQGPVAFGVPNPAPQIRFPLDSETRLGLPPGEPQPPALAVFTVAGPRPLVRTEAASAPMIIAGDGSGVVEAAAAGLLGGDPTILYSASFAGDPTGFARAMNNGASLVLTDTNPLATERWGNLRDNLGQVEQPGVPNLLSSDPSSYALPLFPGASTATNTVAQVNGVTSVAASAYGDPITYTPENRPINAVDGNPATAWSVGAHSPVAGQRLEINVSDPVTANHISLLQVQLQRPNRRITAVTLRFDGSHPLTVGLSAASYKSPGQTVSFPARTFHQLEITVDEATGGADKRYDGLAPVGFAEVGIPGVGPATEALLLPTDLLDRAGAASIDHALTILMSRSRVTEPPRSDPEPTLVRTFGLPTARTFTVGGTAEINAGDSDYLIDQLVGLNQPAGGSEPPPVVVAANSSTRLIGDRQARANAAVDGNPRTAWVTETGPQAGAWMSVTLSQPVVVDHLGLEVVNDGRHSLPTRITVSTEHGSRVVDIPKVPVGYGRVQGATTTIPVSFAGLSGSRLKITIDAVQQVRARDYYSTFSGATDILPVGIAELGLPVAQPAPPAQLPRRCQSGLLRIDGRPVDVEITGSTAAALSGDALMVRPCGNSAAGIQLSGGSHLVQTSPRLPSGWSIDTLSLTSPAEGVATSRVAPARPPPSLRVDHQNRTSVTVTVDGNGGPFWLVLGQSRSAGWQATLPGGRSLGPSQLVDGYANGWYVPAGVVSGPTVIHLTWTPQRVIWAAIGVSAVSLVAATVLAVWPGRDAGWRRRRSTQGRRPRRRPSLAPAGSAPRAWSWASAAGAGGTRPRALTLAAASLGWAVLAALVSRPAIGAAAGAAVAAGCWWRRGRLAVRIAAVGGLVVVGVYVIVQQYLHRYLPDINWPANVSLANDLAWTALALLGADVVIGLMRSRFGAGSTLRGEGPVRRTL
jgi:hypothetical protein